MKKIFNISLFLCLLGLFGDIVYNTTDTHAALSADDYESAIYSTPLPYLFLAEEVQHSGSEINPQQSVTADWQNQEKPTSIQRQYLSRTKGLIVSQSPRTLIFPFHTFS